MTQSASELAPAIAGPSLVAARCVETSDSSDDCVRDTYGSHDIRGHTNTHALLRVVPSTRLLRYATPVFLCPKSPIMVLEI